MRTFPLTLQMMIDDPIVRLMMAADRVAESEMLFILSRARDRVGGPAPEPNGIGMRTPHAHADVDFGDLASGQGRAEGGRAS